MSSGNRGGGSSSNGSIPAASKKMVQSLKEIINCPEAEIYAMLKEHNMDPNEAVNRLLSQDPFHEVKSKREKKKENKDVHEPRPHGTSGTSTRGGRGGVDRYSSRGATSQFGPDSGGSCGKPAYKKDNGPSTHSNSTTGMVGNSINQRQPLVSDATTDKAFPTTTAENFPAALPCSGFQTAWGGMAGQVSMADVVKMGRPHGKASSNLSLSQQHVSNQHAMVSAARPHSNDMHPSQNHTFNVSGMKLESGITESHHVPPNEDWPLDKEPPATSASSVVEPSLDSELGGDAYDRTKQQFRSQADEVRYVEESIGDKIHDNYVQLVPGSNQSIQEANSGSASDFDNVLHQNNSYQVHHQEVEDGSMSVSTVAADFQSMSLPKDDEDSPSEEDGPAVKIPDYLRVQSADCSRLSFGSFGSGMSAPFSESFASRPVKSNDEDAPVAAEALPVGHAEARNPEYYEDEHLKAASDENTTHRMGTDSGNFDTPSVSQPDVLKQEAPEVEQENQYSFPSSTANYSFENSQQLNASFAQQQPSSQMQGLPSLSGVMPYSNSFPSMLLASNMQALRDAELAYSPFPMSMSTPTKYTNSVSSISGPTASMAEAVKPSNFSAAQPTQTVAGSGVSGGPALPQLVNPYAQPSIPMGHYASMLSYPFLPQSYPYLPSAFQQAFAAGNSNFPQSLAAAMLPQYKNSVSASSLPQSAAVASGYGAFGNSNSILSNFPPNHPTAPTGASMSYDDLLISQYKEASHLLSLQQGPGSRTMSGVPGSTYYSFQGQSQQPAQQPAGFRQSQQQPSQQQHYGPLSGYPNFYHSQVVPTLEQQLQMSRDGSLNSPQGQQQKQTPQQIWQNGY